MDERWQDYYSTTRILPFDNLKQAVLTGKVANSVKSFPKESSTDIELEFYDPLYQDIIGNGIESADGRYVFFFGLIDTLHAFKVSKQLESQVRTLQYRRSLVSVTNPYYYCNRFCKAIQRPFQTTQISEMILTHEEKDDLDEVVEDIQNYTNEDLRRTSMTIESSRRSMFK